MRRSFSAFVYLGAIFYFTSCAPFYPAIPHSRIRYSALTSDSYLRKQLLTATPIGTRQREVKEFLEQELAAEGITNAVSIDAVLSPHYFHFLEDQEVAKARSGISIFFKPFTAFSLYSLGLPIRYTPFAEYAFDRQRHLIDIGAYMAPELP